MKTLRRAFVALSISLAAFAAAPVLAQESSRDFLGQIGTNAGYAENQDVSGDGLPRVIGNMVKVLLGLLGIIFLVLTVYGGYLWMIARGDTKLVDKAKETIKQAVIGMIIVTLAYAITSFIIGSVIQGTRGDTSGGACNFGASCTDSDQCGRDGFCSTQDHVCVCLQ